MHCQLLYTLTNVKSLCPDFRQQHHGLEGCHWKTSCCTQWTGRDRHRCQGNRTLCPYDAMALKKLYERHERRSHVLLRKAGVMTCTSVPEYRTMSYHDVCNGLCNLTMQGHMDRPYLEQSGMHAYLKAYNTHQEDLHVHMISIYGRH